MRGSVTGRDERECAMMLFLNKRVSRCGSLQLAIVPAYIGSNASFGRKTQRHGSPGGRSDEIDGCRVGVKLCHVLVP